MNKATKKQAAEQAPVPEFNIRTVASELKKEPKIEPGEHRDKVLIDFGRSDAWKIIKQYMESKLMQQAQIMRKKAEDSSDLQEIGFTFMVTDQINKFASDIINLVESPERIHRMKQDHGQE